MSALRIVAASAHFGRDLVHSMQRISSIVDAARRGGAHLLVLPDATLGGPLDDLRAPNPDSLPPPLSMDSDEIRRVIALAGEMVVCFGFTEDDGGHLWNTALCVHGDGVLGRHRKVHRPPGEALVFAAGDRFDAFDTPLGRMGMLIDYDKTFPEAARTLALRGARTVACLSAWPASVTQRADTLAADRQSRLFDLYDCARAAENQIVWVSANQTGKMGHLRFLGQSKIVGPGGEVLSRTWSGAGLAEAEIDVDAAVDRARMVLHHLTERRPEYYGTEEVL